MPSPTLRPARPTVRGIDCIALSFPTPSRQSINSAIMYRQFSAVNLSVLQAAPPTADDQKIQDAILDLVDHGKMIDGQSYPYSPSLAGAKNERSLLDDAMAAVTNATAPQQWHLWTLRAIIQRTITQMTKDGRCSTKQITKGRFRNGRALRVNRSRISAVQRGARHWAIRRPLMKTTCRTRQRGWWSIVQFPVN